MTPSPTTSPTSNTDRDTKTPNRPFNPQCNEVDLFGTTEGNKVGLSDAYDAPPSFTLKYAHWVASEDVPRIKDQMLVKARLSGLVSGDRDPKTGIVDINTKKYKEAKHKCIQNFDEGQAKADFNAEGFGFGFKWEQGRPDILFTCVR
jgi:hypothetical protein